MPTVTMAVARGVLYHMLQHVYVLFRPKVAYARADGLGGLPCQPHSPESHLLVRRQIEDV